MVEALGPLSARPPTPPRTASRMLSEKDRNEGSPVVLQTPNESPFLTNESAGAPSSRQSKRVNFSPWTKYIKPPTFTNSATKSKTLLPSNECKPTKSILKPSNTNGPVLSPSTTSYTPESFAMLLESLTRQLAGESISSRLDAYTQFFNALRAYEEVPGEDEVVNRLGLITQFIQRDITRDLASRGPLDTNLVIQALKLCVVLVWHPQFSPRLADDFRAFLVDHCISCLEDAKVPKSVLSHYMSVLSTQKFPTKIMTNARTIRMLTVLHELTNRVKGTAIISQRLSIYERVLEQSKSVFASHSALWMDHLISSLLHHFKDIRVKAINLGRETYSACGPNPALSKIIRDIFDRPLDEGRKLASEICERMTRMMTNSDCALHVPQIWGVITLLLRSKRVNIEQWEHFKKWVLVLQKCFNCSDPVVKGWAIDGWNRFVLVANPSETTSRSLLKMLSKPILSQFDRKKPEKHGSQPSPQALASYYNLLYYAFSPSTPQPQLDIVWEEYVSLPSTKTFALFSSLNDRISYALANMLWSSHAKVWTENRVINGSKITPEELPSLDCKWVRSRIQSVLKVFEGIFGSSVWSVDIDKSNIAAAWVNLSRALSSASSKEITPSPESMQAVANVLGLLQRLWVTGPSSLNASGADSMDTFFERFRFLSTTMIVAIGGTPFTEALLLKTADATYQAASTPTHRHPKMNNNLDSPILHFLRLISDVSGISEPTPSYLRLINDTLEATCNGRGSRGPRLELLRQCADLYPNEDEFHFGVHGFAQIVWKSTAKLSSDSLCSFPSESARERDGSVSHDYENIVKILCSGLKFSDTSQAWDQLTDALIRVVRTEKGDRAIATIVVEPLAECITSLNVQKAYLPAASLLNHSLSIPFSDQGSESLVKKTDRSSRDNAVLFPNKIVELARRILREAYEGFTPSEMSFAAGFIESLISFLGSGGAAFRSTLLDKLQEPLALYLKDETGKLTVKSGVESRVVIACRALSSAVLNVLQGALPHDASSLVKFERIITAGLGSSHGSIAKRFVDFWASTFGMQKHLRYPDSISHALQNLDTHIITKTSGSPPPDGPQGATKAGPSRADRTQEDPSAKSRIAFILDEPVRSSLSVHLNSSPVIQGPESAILAATASPRLSRDPSPHKQTQVEDTPSQRNARDRSSPFASKPEGARRHSEVFSMIDNLRSSSPPSTTPKELGFLTPPRLQSLRHQQSEAETPQTPTFPAITGDNEDGFLGSSPTPGIRGRTQSVGPDVPPPLPTSTVDTDIVDPPSSPPDLDSQSLDSRPGHQSLETSPVKGSAGKNRRKRNRNKSKRLSLMRDKKIAMDDPAQSKRVETPDDVAEVEGVKTRLRSSVDKVSANSEPVTEQRRGRTLLQSLDHESTRRPVAGPLPQPPQESNMPQMEIDHNEDQQLNTQHSGYATDSGSDDMDTQVTSQLEKDLVFAVDLDGTKTDTQVTDTPTRVPVTRKRKREEEADAAAHSRKERRRSSRLSTNMTPHVDEARTSRSKKQKTSEVTPSVQSSPASSALNKRKHTAPAPANKSTKNDQKTKMDNEKPLDSQESSQKRRSSRISGVAAPEIPEEVPTPRKSLHSNRSRKSKKRAGNPPTDSRSNSPIVSQEKEGGVTPDVVDPSQTTTQELSIEDNSSHQVSEPRNASPAPTTTIRSPEPVAQSAQLTDRDATTATTTIALVEETPDNDVQMTEAEIRPETKNEPSSQAKTKTQSISKITQTETQTPHGDTGITDSLRKLVNDVKVSSLDRTTLREIDDLLFDLRFEMHEALRRHDSS